MKNYKLSINIFIGCPQNGPTTAPGWNRSIGVSCEWASSHIRVIILRPHFPSSSFNDSAFSIGFLVFGLGIFGFSYEGGDGPNWRSVWVYVRVRDQSHHNVLNCDENCQPKSLKINSNFVRILK